MITTPAAVGLTCALAIPGIVLAVAASDNEPAIYHLAEDTDALWSNTAPGSDRMPTINIADDIYPDDAGVQFLIDDEPDDRDSQARPDGFDATGPQVDSKFHVYPQIDLNVGMALEARWHDRDGDAHRTTWVVGESRFVFGLVGPDLATWSGVDAGKPTEPTIAIDPSIYPNEAGVQFIIDGDIDDRSKARPLGFDPTGPQEGSRYHAYPKLRLAEGMQIEARWIDHNRQGRSSVFIVGSGTVVPPPTTVPTSTEPTPPPETSSPATTATSLAPPPDTIVVTLPSTTTQPPIVTTPPATTPPATTPPATTSPVEPSPVEPSQSANLAGWSDVAPGSGRRPTVTIDGSIYPNGSGVQFLVNEEVDDRNASARPNGYDATGPQDDSTFHVYPDITLADTDRIEARWVDRSGVSHTSVVAIEGGTSTSSGGTPTEAEAAPPPPEAIEASEPITTGGSPGFEIEGDDPNPIWSNGSKRGLFRISPYPVPAGFPTPATAGVPSGTVLTPSGSLEIREAGTVIDGYDINGTVEIRADNVTIRNSRITGGGSHVIRVHKDGGGRTYSNFVIENSRIRGVGDCEAAIAFSNYTARRVYITGCADGAKAGGNTTIVNSVIAHRYKVSDPDNNGGGTHNDGIQSSGGSGIVIRGNTILGAYESSTSAIKVTAEQNDLSNVLIENNYLSGGAFTLYTTQKSYRASGVRVLGNTFEIGSSLFGETKNTASDASYSGNILHDPR